MTPRPPSWLVNAKKMGLFGLSRRLTRHRLRIIAYHGISLSDEHLFRPGLFMTPETFRRRLLLLRRLGFRAVSLRMALDQLHRGTLPADCLVITIDDGWYGTYSHMAPVLEELDWPATLYLSTYYVENQTQVFNVAAAYLLWKAGTGSIDLARLGEGLSGVYELGSQQDSKQAVSRLVAYANLQPDATSRQSILKRLAEILGLDLSAIESRRMLSFMNGAEASELPKRGIELQLHTHRHHLPASSAAALHKEIADNRAALSGICDTGIFEHLCYPSGEYQKSQLAWLGQAGIKSATTTHLGLNTRSTPPLELKRVLDSESLSDLEFEAEICGLKELLRNFTGKRRITAA